MPETTSAMDSTAEPASKNSTSAPPRTIPTESSAKVPHPRSRPSLASWRPFSTTAPVFAAFSALQPTLAESTATLPVQPKSNFFKPNLTLSSKPDPAEPVPTFSFSAQQSPAPVTSPQALSASIGSSRVFLVEKHTDGATSPHDFFVQNKRGFLITDSLRSQFLRPVGQSLETLRNNPDLASCLSEIMEGPMYRGWVVDDVIGTVEENKSLVVIKKQFNTGCSML